MILGIDEAGRGPWAGPLVVGAVVLGGAVIDGLTDSKKLTKKRREALYDKITAHAAGYASGWVSAYELDEIGMSAALKLATKRAAQQITTSYTEIIIDGTVNFLSETTKGRYVTTLPKADLLVPSVSAASIIAKVERDRYMSEIAEQYPVYGFGSHAGYGVAKHRQAIDEHGVTPEHRLSFAPLREYANQLDVPGDIDSDRSRTTTKQIGDAAESAVADFLKMNGHEIIERNWRTRRCEIDIVSLFADTLYFTEVKYRKNADHGDGLAAITTSKLRQMRFAANYYIQTQHPRVRDVRLAAADVAGGDYAVKTWLPLDL